WTASQAPRQTSKRASSLWKRSFQMKRSLPASPRRASPSNASANARGSSAKRAHLPQILRARREFPEKRLLFCTEEDIIEKKYGVKRGRVRGHFLAQRTPRFAERGEKEGFGVSPLVPAGRKIS